MLQRRRRNRGYLLLETVAAITAIAIGLAIILRSFTSSLRASKVAQEYVAASSILKDKLWEIEERAKRDGGLEEFGPTQELLTDDYVLETEARRISEEDALGEVRAAISWKSGRRNEKIEVATYMRCKAQSGK